MTVVPDDLNTSATPPPAVSVVRAMMWNWQVVAVSMVVFIAAAVGAALLRTPEYTATSRLEVGRIDITSPGALSGFALATQALATAYSRTATALAVAKPVSAKTGISVKDVQGHVNATPIPESPVFRIEASAPNAAQAIALANISGHFLIRYSAKLNQDNPDSKRLYGAYRQAIGESNTAQRQLKDAVEAHPSAAKAEEIASARVAVKASSLRADALGKAYTASVRGPGVDPADPGDLSGHRSEQRPPLDLRHLRLHRVGNRPSGRRGRRADPRVPVQWQPRRLEG